MKKLEYRPKRKVAEEDVRPAVLISHTNRPHKTKQSVISQGTDGAYLLTCVCTIIRFWYETLRRCPLSAGMELPHNVARVISTVLELALRISATTY